MFDKLRPRSAYDVMAALALFVAVSTGGAYAANTVFSGDIADGQVKTQDLGDAAVTERKIAPNAVTGSRVFDNNLTGEDIRGDSLTGTDIDEGSLVGGPGAPSGVAGGDLTGSYPNPLIRSNAVGSNEILNKSIGAADLKDTTHVGGAELVPAGGVPVEGVRAVCPNGGLALYGGAYWQYPSGSLSRVNNVGGAIIADGTNRGQREQYIYAYAYCLPN